MSVVVFEVLSRNKQNYIGMKKEKSVTKSLPASNTTPAGIKTLVAARAKAPSRV